MIVRWGQARKANLLWVGAINYATAALACAVLVGTASPHRPAGPTLAIGVAGGIAYVAAYFFLMPAMHLRGVSIASALVRLSVLLPVTLSLVLWHEHPTPLQVAGMLLALVSVPLLGYRPGEALRAGRREYGVLLGLFVLNGLCLTAVKAFREYGGADESYLFFLMLFGTAACISAGACAVRREAPRRRDLAPGLVLGTCNITGNLLLLLALRSVPGVIAFPFTSSVGLLYSVLMARWLWSERITRLEKAGIAIAVAAVALVVR